MFHMPGRWELVFEIRAAGTTDRAAHPVVISSVQFSKEELAKILQHGPWPPRLKPDPTNRVSGKPAAIALGEKLFFEPRLSGTGSVLCATCHAPFRGFQDARPRAFGLELVERNTPSVVNARFYRWYGWDGAQDSLWAQSLRPLLDAREMSASAGHVAQVIRTLFHTEYQEAFGRAPAATDEELLVDAGKALAAFQETLVSGRTAFDRFRDALARGETDGAYPLSAQRGLKIFIGKGNCSACHFGPQFTNGEFADTGVSYFVAPGASMRAATRASRSSRRARSILWGATTTMRRRKARSARATCRRSTATSASSGCRACGAWRKPRRTCTTAASPRCATWRGSIPSSTRSACTRTASASSSRSGSVRQSSTTSSRSWSRLPT
jgi:cytochrome c peroxidase